jgi:hypothetical protein
MSTAAHVHPAASTPKERLRLGRRAQLLAGVSVAYNIAEAIVAIAAGLVAGSVALVGFGLDSTVEVSSGLIILWQFRHRLPETRERQALRLMALSFFALAAYVTVESVRALATGHQPESSAVGIGLAVASLMVMPFLSWAQRRTGRALGSNAVVADATQTLLCTYLSSVLLVGLVLNASVGWSWADPIAGLVIATVAAKEGREAWRGEGCCSPTATTTPPRVRHPTVVTRTAALPTHMKRRRTRRPSVSHAEVQRGSPRVLCRPRCGLRSELDTPSWATPHPGARRERKPEESHTTTGSQLQEERPAKHLGRVWPDPSPSRNHRADSDGSFELAPSEVCQWAWAWLSSSERPRVRSSMIDQNREHFMGSLAGHFRPCSSAVRATSIRCCCSASSASL